LRRPGHADLAGRVDFDPADQLTDADVQIVGERAIDMALEKQRQFDTGDSKRQANGERSGERQTKAERPPDHATFSGIRYHREFAN
jgi:hypothetical protein